MVPSLPHIISVGGVGDVTRVCSEDALGRDSGLVGADGQIYKSIQLKVLPFLLSPDHLVRTVVVRVNTTPCVAFVGVLVSFHCW
jgi:hypothetical protein